MELQPNDALCCFQHSVRVLALSCATGIPHGDAVAEDALDGTQKL